MEYINLTIQPGVSDICKCKLSVNESCAVECESLFVNMKSIYMAKTRLSLETRLSHKVQ